MGSLWQRICNTPRSIAKGLRITLTALRRTKATVYYPEQTPVPAGRQPSWNAADPFSRPYEIAPRYRGLHGLTRNPETGDVNCIGCMACSNVCPDHLISMDLEKREGHSGRYPVTFTVNIGPCCFCGLCSEVCPTPFRALVMTDLFEWASYERFGTNLTLGKDDLLRNGDYEVERRLGGRQFDDEGELTSILPEEEGNPYFQFAAESGKGKKKAEKAEKPERPAKPAADLKTKEEVASAEPVKPSEPSEPAKPAGEMSPDELRARLTDLLTAGGVAVPAAPEEVSLEALEGIEDRKQRSLAKVARRKLRAALGLEEGAAAEAPAAAAAPAPAPAAVDVAEPAKPTSEMTTDDWRARLVELLTQGGVAVPEAPEEVSLEALESIEDRKQRSLAKVARRKLRAGLGLSE